MSPEANQLSTQSSVSPEAARRDLIRLGLLALLVGLITAILAHQPGYTDAYYYLNAAARVAHGQGLTDAALWTYVGAPPGLPAPAFLYWMPFASLLEAVSVFVLGGIVGVFHAGQVPGLIGAVALSGIGYRLGLELGGTRRSALLAGVLTIFSGFFVPYWTNTDTFAVYAVVGSLALWCIGRGRASGQTRWWIAAGVLAGLAHLTRADGLLFVMALVIAALWGHLRSVKDGWRSAMIGVLAYVLTMLPWAIRNLNEIGSVLPVGGFQSAWFSSYDQIASYPAGASLNDFLATGLGTMVQTRVTALTLNLQTFIAVEGLIVLTPLLLVALWRRRLEPKLGGLILYAFGLHGLMTLVFALPGMRGGLLHSAAALVPYWATLGIIGLDDVLKWAAKRRRWPLKQAQDFFGLALIAWAIFFSVLVGTKLIGSWNSANATYASIGAQLPLDAVVMVNDPPGFYYQTGLSAVVLPDSPPSVIPELTARYNVSYLVLDANRTEPFSSLYDDYAYYPFLRLMQDDKTTGIRVYQVLKVIP